MPKFSEKIEQIIITGLFFLTKHHNKDNN